RRPPPPCRASAGAFRPGAVCFGWALPHGAGPRACDIVSRCALLVVVGTSGLVHPAASLPRLARECGARVVEINPVDSAVSAVAHERIRMPAATGIPVLLGRLD